jgi:hypothetical protein
MSYKAGTSVTRVNADGSSEHSTRFPATPTQPDHAPQTLVNALRDPEYTPYCGDGRTCRMPRSRKTAHLQYECPECGFKMDLRPHLDALLALAASAGEGREAGAGEPDAVACPDISIPDEWNIAFGSDVKAHALRHIPGSIPLYRRAKPAPVSREGEAVLRASGLALATEFYPILSMEGNDALYLALERVRDATARALRAAPAAPVREVTAEMVEAGAHRYAGVDAARFEQLPDDARERTRDIVRAILTAALATRDGGKADV